MSRPNYTFKISDNVSANTDFARKRATIWCMTKDGKSIKLELDLPTLEKLREQLENQFRRIWEQ
jgi:hypothetical protein